MSIKDMLCWVGIDQPMKMRETSRGGDKKLPVNNNQKSALVNEVTSRITNSKTFNWQLNKTTDPSELFGPFSIKAMENDRFARKTDNTMVDANFCYLDETFKGNSAVLNSLLQIMNERTFNNDGAVIKCPLITIFGSSNEWASDETLQAFTDRFVFKYYIDYISDKDNLRSLLVSKADGKGSTYFEKLTLEEIQYLHNIVKKVTMNKNIVNSLVRLISSLKDKGIDISDRKAVQCIDILKAQAVLENRLKVMPLDFIALTNVLWDGQADLRSLKKIIISIANPGLKQYEEIRDSYNQLVNGYFATNTSQEKIEYIASNSDVLNTIKTKATEQLTKLKKDAALKEEYTALLTTLNKYQTMIVEVISTGTENNNLAQIEDFLIEVE